MQQLQNAEAQLLVMNLLLQEMARLNHVGQAALQQHQRPQTQPNATSPNPAEAAPPAQPQPAIHIGAPHQQHGQAPPPVFQPFQPFPNQYGQFLPMAPANNPFVARAQTPAYTRHGAGPSSAVIPAGSPDLPEGVVLPPGWSLLPLQRMEQPGPGQLPVPAAPQVHIPRPATTPANSGEVNGQVVPSGGVDVGSSREQQAPPLSDMASTLLSRLLGDQNGAVAGPSSRPAPGESTEPAQRGRSPPVPSVTTQQPQSQQPQPQQSQPAGPQVTAPIPVLPNWGGSAQLFGGGNSGTREASAADLGLGQPSADAPSTQSPAGQEDKADREDVSKQHGSSNGQPTVDKGKGRAVTVEDDDSGDDA
jgi:E3 ubiquitin-protein ligase synoviolin